MTAPDMLQQKDDRSDVDRALIAAAPDMLAALEYIINWDRNTWSAATARDMARAAIAKAKGD